MIAQDLQQHYYVYLLPHRAGAGTAGMGRVGGAGRLRLQSGLAPKGNAHTGAMRITVWVRPGSTRTGVGGERDGALIVGVSKRAVDGQATEAALAAVAAAFSVPRRAVTLVTGAASRTKILVVEGADPATLQRLRTGPR
jgi:uncharacterized protein